MEWMVVPIIELLIDNKYLNYAEISIVRLLRESLKKYNDFVRGKKGPSKIARDLKCANQCAENFLITRNSQEKFCMLIYFALQSVSLFMLAVARVPRRYHASSLVYSVN